MATGCARSDSFFSSSSPPPLLVLVCYGGLSKLHELYEERTVAWFRLNCRYESIFTAFFFLLLYKTTVLRMQTIL